MSGSSDLQGTLFQIKKLTAVVIIQRPISRESPRYRFIDSAVLLLLAAAGRYSTVESATLKGAMDSGGMPWFLCSLSAVILILVLALRGIQRIYYLLRGHSHMSLSYRPRLETWKFFKTNNIPVLDSSTRSVLDRTHLYYKRIGTGPKVIVHSNGVGTDFFIWLPMMQNVLRCDPLFFEKYTIIALAHRGLFVSDGDGPSRVNITLRNCASDVQDVLKHAGQNISP
jgi:hypothetical protein